MLSMFQGGTLNAEQLADQAIQNAADKEAENFHQAHEQIQNTINQAKVLAVKAMKEVTMTILNSLTNSLTGVTNLCKKKTGFKLPLATGQSRWSSW